MGGSAWLPLELLGEGRKTVDDEADDPAGASMLYPRHRTLTLPAFPIRLTSRQRQVSVSSLQWLSFAIEQASQVL